MTSKPSLLGYLLLGLLHQQPQSGYGLRKLFATTPLMSYSDSPGAIYPALRKLQEQRYIRGEVKKGSGLRQRRVFHLTTSGLTELRRWLAQPITRHDVVRNMDQLFARFAFMDHAAGHAASIRLLREMQRELAAYVPELKSYLKKEAPQMPLSARLAMDSGIRNYEAMLQWSRYALAEYAQAEKKTNS